MWGLEGHTIAPAWTALIHRWLGVGPKKPPLTCGVMLGAQRNRSDLKGYFSVELDALTAGRTARDMLRTKVKEPCRVVSWVWTKTREEGRKALQRWGDNSQGMGRAVLSVPMERFPLYQ